MWAGARDHFGGGAGISWCRFRSVGTRFGVGVLLVLVFVLSALVVASSADSGGVSGRGAAVQAALGALGVSRHTGAEIVFGLRTPAAAGTVIAEAGASGPGSGGSVARSSRRVIARLKRPAWFFYEDLAPFQQYAAPRSGSPC